jgi:uncharacterized membrane protein
MSAASPTTLAVVQTRAKSWNEARTALTLSGLIILLAWVPRLFWGFWTDETLTYWMAERGWYAALSRASQVTGQSILHSSIEAFFCVGGPYRELVLRLPSVAGVILAAWLLYRIAERLASAGTGLIAAVAFLCTPSVVEAATNARPYGMALGVTVLSFWSLLRWTETRKTSQWMLYVVSGALIPHFHFLFAIVFLVQAVYLIVWRRYGGRLDWPKLAIAAVIWCLAVLPLREHMLFSMKVSGGFTGAVPLTWGMLATVVFPAVVLLSTALALVLIRVLHPQWIGSFQKVSPPVLVLLFTWAFLGPLLMFALDRGTGRPVFATRYALYCTPAIPLLLAWVGRTLAAQARTLLAVSIFAASILVPDRLLANFQESGTQWRAPLERLKELSLKSDLPVFITSPFAEANDLDWRAADARSTHLLAPLDVYPVPCQTILPLPYFYEKDVRDYVLQTVGKQPRRSFRLLAAAATGFVRSLPASVDALGFEHTTDAVNDYVILNFTPRELRK